MRSVGLFSVELGVGLCLFCFVVDVVGLVVGLRNFSVSSVVVDEKENGLLGWIARRCTLRPRKFLHCLSQRSQVTLVEIRSETLFLIAGIISIGLIVAKL